MKKGKGLILIFAAVLSAVMMSGCRDKTSEWEDTLPVTLSEPTAPTVICETEETTTTPEPTIITTEKTKRTAASETTPELATTTSAAPTSPTLPTDISNVPISEYTPLQIKQAVTGYGRADKKQIIYMVTKLLSLKAEPHPDDTADALAAAICHAYSSDSILFGLK